jgi:putative transposase
MAHQSRIKPERLVFIDETWTKTNMAPLRGWAPRGARLVAKVPHGHWKTLTFVAALRHDRIEAPFVLDGPVNGECFKTYVEKVLVPTLAAGDLVLMDNLGSHKGKAIRRAIRAAGAKLFFLPKYSPDLNPIEQVFAKAETPPTQSGGTHRRSRHRRHRPAARNLHPSTMHQLFDQCRIWTNLISTRSRQLPYPPLAIGKFRRHLPALSWSNNFMASISLSSPILATALTEAQSG